MRRIAMLTGILVFLCLSAAVAQELAPDLKIVPPAAGVPPRLAQLSGIWEGAWESSISGKTVVPMDAIGWGIKVAIVEITPPKVEAFYATSGSPGNPGKSFRVRDASIAGEAIVLKWGQPGEEKTITLTPSGKPGVAQATMETEGKTRVYKATLRKK